MSKIDVSPGTLALATSYTWISQRIEARQHEEVSLYGVMTVGSATALTLRIDSSDDGENWSPVLDPDTGLPVEKAYTPAAAFCVPLYVPSHAFVRVQAKVDSVTGSPTLALGFVGDGKLL